MKFPILCWSLCLLAGVLSRLKIASLDGERKQAKVEYTEHMNSYATKMFGRPMEKLNVSTRYCSNILNKENFSASVTAR